MKYELGKELKDAGYYLHPASMEDANDSKRKRQIFDYGKDGIGRPGSWLYPTLPELIEACGDNFYSLTQIIQGEWQAVGPWNKEETHRLIINFNATPEEAVARLWLALKKKII